MSSPDFRRAPSVKHNHMLIVLNRLCHAFFVWYDRTIGLGRRHECMLREEVKPRLTTFLCTNLTGQKFPLIIKIERLVALTRINSVN